ncbi:MAG: hypothetical protein CL760_01790 [Chloroflexi bacterium]|nr:hypothetical protein [Chloroflexota bacterium]|tara:strand:- start:25034 stop:25741 length:708 start_codon:yes stop_codon:yes gene_type:complete
MRKDLKLEYVYLVNEILSNKSTADRLWTLNSSYFINVLISIKNQFKKHDDFCYFLTDLDNLIALNKIIKSTKIKHYLNSLNDYKENEKKQSKTVYEQHLQVKSQLSCLGQIEKSKIINKKLTPETMHAALEYIDDVEKIQNFYRINGLIFENGIFDIDKKLLTFHENSTFFTYSFKNKSKTQMDLKDLEENNDLINLLSSYDEELLEKIIISDIDIREDTTKEELEDLVLLYFGN